MNDADRQAFSSVAAAQCSVTNDAYQWLRQQCPHGRMLFCPTPYCDRMVRWGLGGADYLDIVGESLHPSIEVFWTGPEIISRTISVDSIARLTERIRRPPVIWDNLHANDYDMRRLYCGPYSGREVELKRHVRGIISNPNCEFPINYVPLRTLADYLSTDEYDPSESYLAAIDSWSECFGTIGEPVRRVDVQFLADCFYLPFDQGESARELYERVANLVSQPVSNWGNRDQFVYDLNQRMRSLSDQLTQLRDRELFYAWSRRAWELREELELISDFLQKKRAGLDEAGAIRTEKHLPHTYRGGTVAQLQTLLTPDGSGRIRAADCMNWTK